MFTNLEEVWVISGKRGKEEVFSVHQLIEELDGNVIDILPAVQDLTGIISETDLAVLDSTGGE